MTGWRRLLATVMAVFAAAGAAHANAPIVDARSPGKELAQEELEGIRGNAAMVREELAKLRGAALGYDKDSIAWTEGFIERKRKSEPEGAKGLVSTLGSYLGEAIVANTEGEWRRDEERRIGIRFPNGDWCYPFDKVEKQIANGHEDGITSFYDISVNFIATGALRKAREETP